MQTRALSPMMGDIIEYQLQSCSSIPQLSIGALSPYPVSGALLFILTLANKTSGVPQDHGVWGREVNKHAYHTV